MIKKSFLLGAIVSIITTNAIANQVITSQTYVDNADARKVDIAQGAGDNNENVGKTLVVNSSGNLELGTVSASNFVEDSITDGVTDKAPSENAVNDALAEKQDIIPAGSDGANGSVVTYGATAGDVDERFILDSANINDQGFIQNYLSSADKSISNTTIQWTLNKSAEELENSLVPAKYIDYGFSRKQNKIQPGTTGSVVVYNGSADGSAEFTEKAVSNVATYSDGTLTNGNDIASINAVETKQNKMTCTRWIDNAAHTDANCLLWNMAN